MSDTVEILNPQGQGQVVILCEHASHHIPQIYDGLGLAPEHREGHAVWDPGARALSLQLSKMLDAPVVASCVSRLVYDCNRPPNAHSAMPVKSELVDIPGNIDLSQTDRDLRIMSVYEPFCAAVSQVLEHAKADTVVVTVHSFTPVYYGKRRRVELGLLHDEDSRLVDAMLAHKAALPKRVTLRNEPYGPEDGVTHSLRIHALSRGLANVMIEVRNDLLQTDEQISAMAQEILTLLMPALKEIAFKEDES
ncbi:N-formylglutamate amidohydrolase [Roseovarius sp. EL26]|uniref:N-formylglutamate amidohydrolase n=1 Tax=Roseovarius sp. EL26 TaxID=2126672 RepID=UPI000EA26A0D|nr:N-formylglutamate amidohydrolase [Roseovarius sp. EL26]